MVTPSFSSFICKAIHSRTGLSFVVIAAVLSGCGSLPDFSALEDDELYLHRGEEFVTDSKYLAFALDQAGMGDVMDDDYYDSDRSAYGEGYVGGFGAVGYQPSYNNPNRPFSNGIGLQSYFNPMNGSGMGMGYGGFNGMNTGFGFNNSYDPFGYNSMGYNPYGFNGWNNAYNPYGSYNPYNNNGWNNGWNNGNMGPYFGSANGEGSSVTSFTRTPIMSYTNNGSNYDDEGVLVRPKVETDSNGVQPAAVTPESSKRQNRWMQSSSSTKRRSTRSEESSGKTEWNSRSRSGGNSNSFSAPSSIPRSNTTRSSGGNSRSSGNTPKGSSNGKSRSSRGGGQ